MKKIIVLVCFVVAWQYSYAQSASDVIKKAQYLETNQKYESAFKALNNFDPNNQIPEMVLLKMDIALNGYVSTIDFQSFSFIDIGQFENILDYRNKAGSYSNYNFPIDKVLNSLIKVYPTKYELYDALANYYAAVEMTFDDQWLISVDSIHQLIKNNFQIAINHNVADDFCYYEVGYVDITQENYKESIPYFLKSIALNKDNPDACYNLAYAYLYTDDKDNALKYAKMSLHLYEDSVNQGDAARMIGEIYAESKDTSGAIKYYELSDNIDAENYSTLEPLLYLYVKTNKEFKLKQTLIDFFYLDPENPTIYNDLSNMFQGSKHINTLTDFYKSKLPEFSDNKKVTGNLYFYLAEVYLDSDKPTAKSYFLKARQAFATVFSFDNEVFKAIDQGLGKAGE